LRIPPAAAILAGDPIRVSAYFRIEGVSASDGVNHRSTLEAGSVVARIAEAIQVVIIKLLIAGTGFAGQTGGHAMKLRTHLPGVSIGARDWRATIAVGSFLGALVLILTVRSGVSFTNQSLDRLGASSSTEYHGHLEKTSRDPQNSSTHRVSLIVHSQDQAQGFSVAHTLPAEVALSQRFSVGASARNAFEVFGERALRRMSANHRQVRELKPRGDRMMLMLMLLRLRDERRG
jgi:hypothetical protein